MNKRNQDSEWPCKRRACQHAHGRGRLSWPAHGGCGSGYIQLCQSAYQVGPQRLPQVDSPWGVFAVVQRLPPHTSAWSHTWGTHVPGETCQGGSSIYHLNSCSHSTSTPSTNLSTPQPSTRFRQTQWRNGHDLGLLLGRTMDAAQVAYGFCDHTRLTCFSDCLCSDRACIQWQQSLMASTPITGADPHPWQGYNSHKGKRRPCPTSIAGSGDHNANHTCRQGCWWPAHSEKRPGWHPYPTALAPIILDSPSTRGWSHMKTALQDHSR